MRDSHFWRLVAVGFVAGVFYLGHASGQRGATLTPFTSQAHAQETSRYRIPTAVPQGTVVEGFRWNQISNDRGAPRTFRAQVQGGWLIATLPPDSRGASSVHTVFVPDVYHWWHVD